MRTPSGRLVEGELDGYVFTPSSGLGLSFILDRLLDVGWERVE